MEPLGSLVLPASGELLEQGALKPYNQHPRTQPSTRLFKEKERVFLRRTLRHMTPSLTVYTMSGSGRTVRVQLP